LAKILKNCREYDSEYNAGHFKEQISSPSCALHVYGIAATAETLLKQIMKLLLKRSR
jgi:hypothetical protein